MANTIKHKRGTTTPTAGQLVVGEIAINTTTGAAFTKTDGGSVVALNSNNPVFTGDVTAGTNLVSTFSSGDEGGEIQLAKPATNTTLAGAVSVDIYQNKIRFFENGGSTRGAYIDITACTTGVATNLLSGGGGSITWGSITGTLSSQTDLQNALNLKATLASPALTGNVTITTNSSSPALIIVQDGAGDIVQFKDVASDSTYSFIDAAGKVSTIATTTSNAGLNIPHGTAPTSPVNGDIWTTTAGLFGRINGATQQYAKLDSPTLSGTPNATTATSSDNSTRIATTAFVKAQSYLTSSSLTGYALLTGTSAIQVTGATIRSIDGSDNFVSLDQGVLNFGTSGTVSGLSISGSGITFPDSTTQTTATATGPAGADGLNGAMNYLDIVTVTSSSNPGYYESGGSWSVYYAFMNTGAGWFYGKLNSYGVDFKLYINGTYDSTNNSAYNSSSASGTLVGSPTTGDVITIFISDGTNDATIPIVEYTY